MIKSNKFLIVALAFCLFAAITRAAEMKVITEGKWGKKSDQLGINMIEPGILPTGPFMGPGGFDVETSGKIWISDSVNHQIKSWFNREWRETMVNCNALGEVCLAGSKLYVVTRDPNGFIIFNTTAEKIEKQVKVDFKSPGRIASLRSNLIAIEELSGGVWLIEDEKPAFHPAIAMQACGNGTHVFGLQKDLLSENQQIVRAELSKEVQEPEVVGVLESENRVVYARLATLLDDDPVIMITSETEPQTLQFVRVSVNGESRVKLPLIDGPYMISPWKICSDGKIYTLGGNAEGFKIFAAEKNF